MGRSTTPRLSLEALSDGRLPITVCSGLRVAGAAGGGKLPPLRPGMAPTVDTLSADGRESMESTKGRCATTAPVAVFTSSMEAWTGASPPTSSNQRPVGSLTAANASMHSAIKVTGNVSRRASATPVKLLTSRAQVCTRAISSRNGHSAVKAPSSALPTAQALSFPEPDCGAARPGSNGGLEGLRGDVREGGCARARLTSNETAWLSTAVASAAAARSGPACAAVGAVARWASPRSAAASEVAPTPASPPSPANSNTLPRVVDSGLGARHAASKGGHSGGA
uniref:Uncharacterized protein n=1 Tax=Pyrodinium bahamense TaxID=73915 RepID=A0A7R9ZY26_9DINO